MIPTEFLNDRPHWSDVFILTCLAVLAGVVSAHSAHLLNTTVLIDRNAHDLWFDADIPLVFSNLTTCQGARSEVHPLFPLLDYPPAFYPQKLF